MINLVVVKNPFKTDKEIKQVNYIPGQTVFSYIQPGFMGVEVVISHNGQIVPEDEYQSVIPAPGDYIAVCPVIEGGGDGGGKDIGRTLAVIALSIVTMGVGSVVAGGAFWGLDAIVAANWGFWSWVAAAGVRVAGGYLINQWFPPGKEEEQKRVYGWGQLPPISTEGDSIPVTFGTAKMGIMAPVQTIAQHVTTDGEKQYLNLLLSGGEGPIDSIADLKINDNPYTNYDGVAYETRLGANDQSIISNFNDTYFPQAVSFELEEGAAPSVQQLSGEYSGIEVTLDFPAGLYRVDNEGKFKSTSVKVQLKTRLVGSSTWVNWDTKTISGKYTHAIRREYNKHSLPQGQYEVSVQCTYKSGSGDKYSNAVHWTAVSGIVYDDFTYPNKVLVGLKALATDQLSGGMPRITWTQTRNNVWVWDPFTGAYEQKAASNPAWACYDIIHRCRRVRNINTGSYEYSVSGVSAARIDYQAFVDWATFCDNRQIYFNGVIYQAKTLWESLKEPEQAGRGRVLMRGTRFSCVCDAPGVPVQLFNVSNTGIDSFKEEFLGTQDRANALELSFYNIDNNYEKTTIPVYGPGYDEETAIQNPTQVRLDFAMTLAQAYKYGAYQLRVNHYINRMVSWSADIDAIACQIGDVVLVQHDVPRWGIGGRVISATANTVTLDQEVTLFPGVNYGVMIRLTDDTLIEKAVQSVAQETTTDTLTATEAFSSIPEQDNLFSFGEVERVAKPFRLMSVSREGDFRCKLQGMEYIEEVYGETTDIPIIDYPQPTGKISNVSVIQYIEDYNAMIGISWDPPEAFYNGARVIIDNKQVGRVDAHESSFEYLINHIPEGVQINIKIEAFNDFDNVIDDSIVLWTVQPKTTFPPNDVTWGEAIFTNKVYLNWNPVNNYDLEGYEVRTDTNFGSDDIGLVYRGKETHYTIQNPTQRSYTLYIKAFSWSKKYSTNATPLTIENTIPIAPPQPTITEFFGSLWIEVAPNGEIDIEKYNVYITPSDGAGNPTGTTEKIVLATAPNKITYEASPGQSFLIEIAAEDVLSEGLKSAPAEATTKHVEAPDIPDGLLSESKLENSLKSKIDTAKSNSDDYANQVIAYPTEENENNQTTTSYTLTYSAGDIYVGTEIETDPNAFFDITDQEDNEIADDNGNPIIIIGIVDESGTSLLGSGKPTWYGEEVGETVTLVLSSVPAVSLIRVHYGVKKKLSQLAVDGLIKKGVTAKQIDANVLGSIEAMRGFPWNSPVPADMKLINVESRVTSNEGNISTNQTSISQNATTIQTNATKINAAENNITANQTSIAQNADGINVNAAKIQTNENDISANSASIQVNADSIAANVTSMKEYIQSRGENLITNGSGLLGDNTNFSSFEFDGSDAYGCAGSFKYTGKSILFNDELMPVNPDLEYKLSAFAKANPYVGAIHYLGITCYDVDKNSIGSNYHMYIAGTLTILAQDLKDGDTVVYLADATNWINSAGTSTHKRQMIFWDYQNSYGYQYPPETYSRHTSGRDTWAGGAVNYTTNSITLNSPWSGGLIPAGTELSNGSAGGTYKYIAMSATIVPDEWTKYDGLIGEIDYSGQNIYTKFTPGTAYVKLLFLADYNNNGGTIWFSNLSFAVDVAKQGDLDTTNTNLINLDIRVTENEADIQINSDSITSTVHELHSSKWQNLFTSWDGSEWIRHTGNPTITVVDEPTAINGKVLQVEGFGWYSLNENIPFDPESMYIIKIRARQTVDDIGKNRIYCGLNGVAADGVTLINTIGANTWSGQHYVAVSGHTLTVPDGWKEWTGYIQGYSTSAGWQSNNPQDPGKMYPGVTFIRPMFVVNYQGDTGTTQVDYMILKLDSKESWSQVNQLANEYTVKLQQHANGQDYIAGFGLAIDGGISEFGILADRFKIYGNPADSGETATPVFALDTHSGKLFLLADLIADGTVTARMIGSNEIITDTANIKDAIIDSAKIINVEANKITTNEAKIQSAQIESIQAEQIKVGGQPVQLVNPKPQGAQLWHFDRSVVSTDGLQPEAEAVYTLRPGEGKYGGSVAVEGGTENLLSTAGGGAAQDWSKWGHWNNSAYWGATVQYDDSNWGKVFKGTKDGATQTNTFLFDYYPYSFSIGDILTFSCWMRLNKSITKPIEFYLVSSSGGQHSVASKDIKTITFKSGEWQYITWTSGAVTETVSGTGGFGIFMGTGWEGCFVEVAYPQFEKKPFATSFVDGARAGGNLSFKPSNMGINLNEGAWTIACWAKYKEYQMTGGVRAPVLELGSYYLAGETSWTVGPRQSTNRLYLVLYSNQETEKHGGHIQYTSSEAIDWILVVLRKINVNTVELVTVSKESGLQKASVSSTQWSSNPVRDNLFVGRYGWTERMNGLIDELIVVPRAVSDEEIQSWYNSQAPFYDSGSVIGAGRMQITSDGLKAYNANGVKTVDIGSSSGDAYFKGTVEAGALILPVRSGAPVG